jgi:hypothetical protein
LDCAAHRADHGEVLVPFTPGATQAACQLVVVPTSRPHGSPASGLALAAAIARTQNCPLLVLVSGAAAARKGRRHIDEVVGRATFGRRRPIVLDVSCVDRHLLGFDADASALARFSWAGWPGLGDTALKRNIAVLLARRLEWERVLFIDDDIVPRPQDTLPDGIALVAESVGVVMGAITDDLYSAVGWAAVGSDDERGYADNSVVCRIRRHLGYQQGVFVGGGALAVRVGDGTPHFPRIYNEDWLFCLALLLREGRGSLALGGQVTQDFPSSTVDDVRARMEEPGDILAEGLMNLFGATGGDIARAEWNDFWRHVILSRIELVRGLAPHLDEGTWSVNSADELRRARAALAATQVVHAEMDRDLDVWSQRFCDYVSTWLNDAKSWSDMLADAGRGSLPSSLGRLLEPWTASLHAG